MLILKNFDFFVATPLSVGLNCFVEKNLGEGEADCLINRIASIYLLHFLGQKFKQFFLMAKRGNKESKEFNGPFDNFCSSWSNLLLRMSY